MAQFGEDGVFLEPGPQHRKIVDLVEVADVIAPDAHIGSGLFEMVDDLALSGGGTGDEQEYVERVVVHKGALKKV